MILEPPDEFGPMRQGDIDTRSRDWGGDLAKLRDTITEVAAVTITRLDKVPMTNADLTWVPPAVIDASLRVVTVSLKFGLPGVTYILTMGVHTLQGRTLFRDGTVTVAEFLG